MEPRQHELITTLGNLGIIRGFHFLDPLGGLGRFNNRMKKRMGTATMGNETDKTMDNRSTQGLP